MSQPQLYGMLLISLVMGISGIKELYDRRYAFGALMIGVPLLGWVSVIFGK